MAPGRGAEGQRELALSSTTYTPRSERERPHISAPPPLPYQGLVVAIALPYLGQPCARQVPWTQLYKGFLVKNGTRNYLLRMCWTQKIYQDPRGILRCWASVTGSPVLVTSSPYSS